MRKRRGRDIDRGKRDRDRRGSETAKGERDTHRRKRDRDRRGRETEKGERQRHRGKRDRDPGRRETETRRPPHDTDRLATRLARQVKYFW